jgi:hypothetical protein
LDFNLNKRLIGLLCKLNDIVLFKEYKIDTYDVLNLSKKENKRNTNKIWGDYFRDETKPYLSSIILYRLEWISLLTMMQTILKNE